MHDNITFNGREYNQFESNRAIEGQPAPYWGADPLHSEEEFKKAMEEARKRGTLLGGIWDDAKGFFEGMKDSPGVIGGLIDAAKKPNYKPGDEVYERADYIPDVTSMGLTHSGLAAN